MRCSSPEASAGSSRAMLAPTPDSTTFRITDSLSASTRGRTDSPRKSSASIAAKKKLAFGALHHPIHSP
jgi:hypothetical protein